MEPVSTIQGATQIFNTIANIFKKRPNPNDHKGWLQLDRKNNLPDGTNAVSWVIKDGDSVYNEALNILSFMNTNIDGRLGLELILGHNSHFNRTITNKDIAAKLRRANMHNEANNFENLENQNIKTAPVASFFGNIETSIFRPTPLQQVNQQIQPKKMSFNIWITVGIIATAFTFVYQYFIVPNNKKNGRK